MHDHYVCIVIQPVNVHVSVDVNPEQFPRPLIAVVTLVCGIITVESLQFGYPTKSSVHTLVSNI